MCKMLSWNKWSPTESSIYRNIQYIDKIYKKFNIESYRDQINELVLKIMNIIKNDDCSKRTRFREGIIYICILYIYKLNKNDYIIDNKTKLNLPTKYISKAEKNILELIQHKKINPALDINIFTSIFTLKHNKSLYTLDNIHETILLEVDELISYCNNNEILIEHSPSSIYYGCLYYILKKKELVNKDNVKQTCLTEIQFSKKYDISHVTVKKIYNKLIVQIKI